MRETKCDYCGFKSTIMGPGDDCPKCRRGIMCERGGRGWPVIKIWGPV